MGKLNNLQEVSHFSGSGEGVIPYEYANNVENSIYEIYYSDMDDVLTEHAISNLDKKGGFSPNEYRILLNDCNAYTRAVFREYKNLWKENYKKEQGFETETLWGNISSSVKAWIAWWGHYDDITARSGETVKIGRDNGKTQE